MNAEQSILKPARTEAPEEARSRRVRCQSQPQLNSRAAQSVQEQRQLSLQRRRDGLIADSVESRLLKMSAYINVRD